MPHASEVEAELEAAKSECGDLADLPLPQSQLLQSRVRGSQSSCDRLSAAATCQALTAPCAALLRGAAGATLPPTDPEIMDWMLDVLVAPGWAAAAPPPPPTAPGWRSAGPPARRGCACARQVPAAAGPCGPAEVRGPPSRPAHPAVSPALTCASPAAIPPLINLNTSRSYDPDLGLLVAVDGAARFARPLPTAAIVSAAPPGGLYQVRAAPAPARAAAGGLGARASPPGCYGATRTAAATGGHQTRASGGESAAAAGNSTGKCCCSMPCAPGYLTAAPARRHPRRTIR